MFSPSDARYFCLLQLKQGDVLSTTREEKPTNHPNGRAQKEMQGKEQLQKIPQALESWISFFFGRNKFLLCFVKIWGFLEKHVYCAGPILCCLLLSWSLKWFQYFEVGLRTKRLGAPAVNQCLLYYKMMRRDPHASEIRNIL